MNRYRIRISGLVLFAVLLCNSLCYAHRLNVFAYAEDGDIYCEARFSGGKPAMKCVVSVLQVSSGKLLLTEATNREGNCSFPLSAITHQNQEIKVEVRCDDGHMNSWRLLPEEYLMGEAGEERQQRAEEVLQKSPSVKNIFIGLGIIFAAAGLIKCIHYCNVRRKK